MCIALIAHQVHATYPLVIAANRDEFHARPTTPAGWWPEQILAGKDLVAGGTWFGVHRNGRIALLMNFRDGLARDPAARSRGELVVTALSSTRPARRLLTDVLSSGDAYQGYSLIAGQPGDLYCASNRNWMVSRMRQGVFGLSNQFLDTSWPKVDRAKDRLRTAMEDAVVAPEGLFELLRDTTQAADHELPDTGIGLERERFLSSPFIIGENYGTRSSTVLLLDRTGGVLFIERTFDRNGEAVSDARYDFTVSRPLAVSAAGGA
ncbi:MAG: NRDE family protein [Betaproteobacteria bacterium]